MPASAAEPPIDGRRLAVVAESLYLATLFLLPVVGVAGLAVLWWRHRLTAPPLARHHLRQTLRAALGGTVLLLFTTAYIVTSGGFVTLGAWAAAEIYIIVVHTPLILLGLAGLLKAMAGKPLVLRLIGVGLD